MARNDGVDRTTVRNQPRTENNIADAEAHNEPIIANLIRKYNLDVSILYGSIDYIQNVSFGRLIIMINGHEEDMKKALGHLQSLPITSEVIGYVPSDN